jgi:hypothetical protein
VYESSTNPPTLVHSITQDRLFFLCPTSTDTDPLAVLEFLHRVADVFEDFLGSPLLASKIQTSYDVLAQVLGEMCDSGAIATTEPNALRDLVEAPTLMNKLLGGVGLPSSSPSLSSSPTTFSSTTLGNAGAPAIPWRRNNVRHTSNELYVDILETLHVITAPSGQPLAAFAHGSVIFTAKVSGIPDLFLSFGSQAGGPNALASILSLPVFHPCVRLARWKEKPGQLSFVPPDGRFLLMGYEVDLLGPDYLDRRPGKGKKSFGGSDLQVPATVAVRTGLGPSNAEFEIRLSLDPKFASKTGTGSATNAFNKPSGLSAARNAGTSSHPTIEELLVKVPITTGVRNLGEMKASKGEARWAPGEKHLEWRISSKDIGTMLSKVHSSSSAVVATLRCTVVGVHEEVIDTEPNLVSRDRWDYDESEGNAYQTMRDGETGGEHTEKDSVDRRKQVANQALMPSSATISFQVKGWLASGIRVDKLAIDPQRSRGLGAGVQPYKGVKYVTVSDEGIETRC